MKCFMIGPIGDKLAPLGSEGRTIYEQALDVFEQVIEPACRTHDLEPVRADQIALPGEITTQILRHLRDDDLVIADISGGNPNVMYELGLRHSTGKPVIQIGEYGQLPFDVAGVRTIQFSRSERGLIEARRQLERTLSAFLVDGADTLTPGNLWLTADEDKAAISDLESIAEEYEPDDLATEDEDGLIERVEKLEESLESLTAVSGEIVETMEDLGEIAESSTAEMQAAAEAANSRERLAILARFSSKISPPAERLEGLTTRFEKEFAEIDSSVIHLARIMVAHPQVASRNDRAAFVEMVTGLVSAAHDGMEGLSSFAHSAEGLGALSRLLRVPGRRISNAVRTMASAVARMDSWEAELDPILAQIGNGVAAGADGKSTSEGDE